MRFPLPVNQALCAILLIEDPAQQESWLVAAFSIARESSPFDQ